MRYLADHSEQIKDLSGLDEYLGILLLREIIARQKLTYNLAQVFIASFPGSTLSETLAQLDLFAGIPSAPSPKLPFHAALR